jgi:PAS domain S-box-containing protein
MLTPAFLDLLELVDADRFALFSNPKNSSEAQLLREWTRDAGEDGSVGLRALPASAWPDRSPRSNADGAHWINDTAGLPEGVFRQRLEAAGIRSTLIVDLPGEGDRIVALYGWAKRRACGPVQRRFLASTTRSGFFLPTPPAQPESGPTLDRHGNALALALEATSAACFSTDAALTRLEAGPAFDALFGLPPGHPRTPSAWMDQVLPEDRLPLENARRSCLRSGGTAYHCEYRIQRRRDGAVRWLLERGKGLPGGGFVGVLEDLSPQKTAQTERMQFLASLEASSDAVFLTDVSGEILYVNPAFEQALGYSAAEAVGRNPRLLNSGRQSPSSYRALWEALNSGGMWTGRLVEKRKDGSLAAFDAKIGAVPGPDGRPGGHYAVLKAADAAVHSEKLRQARRMELTGKLAGGAAHDFNNMLSVIIGVAELELGRVGGPGRAPAASLDRIHKAALRAAELSRHLLAFGRKTPGAPQPLELGTQISSLLPLLRRALGGDFRVVWEPLDRGGKISADPARLDQLVARACLEAAEISGNTGECLLQSARLTRPSAPGEPEAEHVCLSLRFPRPETCTATNLEDDARDAGAVLECEDAPASRTLRLFWKLLPPAPALPAPAEAAPRPAPASVLLVEADPAALGAAKRMLELLGHRVTTARSAEEALTFAARGETVDLLVCGRSLPDMDGALLGRRLSSAQPRLRRLFLGAPEQLPIPTELPKADGSPSPAPEAERLLAKPFSFAQLAAEVGAVLER